MELLEFKQKVKNRIINDFLRVARKPKADLVNFLSILLIFSAPVINVFLIYLVEHFKIQNNELQTIIACFMVGFVGITFGGIFVTCKNIKSYFNFKKSSDKYFQTLITPAPIIETDNELFEYINKTNVYYCKNISANTREELYDFSEEELNELKEIKFNDKQKNIILEYIENGYRLEFFMLQKLLAHTTEVIKSQEQQKKQNRHTYSDIISAIGFGDLLLESKTEKLKYKLKEIL